MNFVRDDPANWERLDFLMLQSGAVFLYKRKPFLSEDADKLGALGYRIFAVDCDNCADETDLHRRLAAALSFPDYYGRNLSALNDVLLNDLPDAASLVAVVLHHFHSVVAMDDSFATAVLNIFARASRDWMLYGDRLVLLVQTDDGSYHGSSSLGGLSARWNEREWLNSERL